MKEMPLISIIIPTCNRADLIGETLNSIIKQTYTNWECIIVDDGSFDETEGVIKEFCEKDGRFIFHDRPKNRQKGANSCRNYGFELSQGTYINWFDSDDIMHPSKLELQILELKRTECSLCVCQTQLFQETIDNKLGLRHPTLISENFWEDYLMFKIMWLTQAPLWERDFLLKMGRLFDEELHAAQEWEFHLRALSRIHSYSTIEQPLVYLRIHNNSISTSTENRETVLWNYFLARYKIYQRFKKQISPSIHDFLCKYMLESYKSALRNSQMKLAGKIWKKYIISTENISFISKFRLSMGYLSFFTTKKGNKFISDVNN